MKIEKNQLYVFNLEKKRGNDKVWSMVKCEDGTYKENINDILGEQLKFYEKLFTSEGWDEDPGKLLLQHINN